MNHLSTEDFAQITEDWPGFRANYCKLKGISQDDLSYLLKHKLIEADDFQYDFKVMEGMR